MKDPSGMHFRLEKELRDSSSAACGSPGSRFGGYRFFSSESWSRRGLRAASTASQRGHLPRPALGRRGGREALLNEAPPFSAARRLLSAALALGASAVCWSGFAWVSHLAPSSPAIDPFPARITRWRLTHQIDRRRHEPAAPAVEHRFHLMLETRANLVRIAERRSSPATRVSSS